MVIWKDADWCLALGQERKAIGADRSGRSSKIDEDFGTTMIPRALPSVTSGSSWLWAAALLNLAAALLHFACILGGARWYRAVGAGERLVRQLERGSSHPHIIAAAIGCVLLIWATFALSGAGAISSLPFTRFALLGIFVIYSMRVMAYPWMVKSMPDRSRTFLQVSSVIVFVFATVHGVGIWFSWNAL